MNLGSVGIVGWSAVGVLVALWLVVSFSAAGPRREIFEWLAATSMYVALSMLFLHLTLQARESGSTVGLVAFGFLGILFASGLVVALVHTLRSLRGPSKTQASATN